MTVATNDATRIEALWTDARDALAADNLLLAEAAADEILLLDPAHEGANALFAHLARLIHLDALAARWTGAGEGKRFAPVSHPGVASLLADCRACPHGERFLLIKAWGYGFWSDVFHVLGALLLAEVTGRIPYVLWGDNSLFAPEGCDNAFALYFRDADCAAWAAIRRVPATEIFPVQWQRAGIETAHLRRDVAPHRGGTGRMGALWLLNRSERLLVSDFFISPLEVVRWLPDDHPLRNRSLDEIVRTLFERYLMPQPRIVDGVDGFRNGPLAGRRTAAFHIRASDKIIESPQITEVNALYAASAERAAGSGYALWLMTDSSDVARDWRIRFGDAVVCQDALRVSGTSGTHHATPRDARQRIGDEVLIDVLVGAGCDRFLGNGASNPSCMVDFLMEGDETRKHLFIENRCRHRPLVLYRDGWHE